MLLPTDPTVDLGAEVAFLREQVERLRQQLAERSFGPAVMADARDIVGGAQSASGAQTSIDQDALNLACSGIMRAKIENARILAAQLEGRYDETAPKDPLFTGMQPTGLPPIGEDVPTKPETFTFGDLCERFYAFKKAGGAADKTLLDIERVARLAQAVIKPEKDVRKIDAEDMRRMRDHVATLKMANGGTVSIVTQEKYFRFFKALIRWGVDEAHIPTMPGEKIKIAGASKVKSIDQRRPYSAAQLEAIFGSPLYTGCESVVRRHKPGEKIIRDGYWWTPLIALTTGMRLGEIIQLDTADVKEEGGIVFFDVSKSEDGSKRLKTAASARLVPVPAILFDLGFAEMLKRADPKRRLFEEIEIGSTGFPSHIFSKWWGRFARSVGFHEDRTAFHSFRHAFADGCRDAGVPDALAKAIMGHTDGSVHALYGSKPPVALLKEAIDRVRFTAIDPKKLVGKT